MRICALGSGSRGNATLIDSGQTRLLVDCGFPARELDERAGQAGFDLNELDAILVTHEHGDHIRGVGPVARRYDVPVYATHGTLRSGKCGKLPEVMTVSPHADNFTIGNIQITAVAVPHDAAEPCQYIFASEGKTAGMLTDLGCITPLIVEAYRELDMLLLECNHDVRMLAEGPYPVSLQARVGGNRGHLNNLQSMTLLDKILTQQLQHLVLGHLSEKNNHPELVLQALDTHCGHLNDCATILEQHSVSDWFDVVSA